MDTPSGQAVAWRRGQYQGLDPQHWNLSTRIINLSSKGGQHSNSGKFQSKHHKELQSHKPVVRLSVGIVENLGMRERSWESGFSVGRGWQLPEWVGG